MRYKNEGSDLKLYVVAGTQTVLLSFDIAKEKVKSNFLGFSIERKDKDGKITLHNGSKHFDSLIHDDTITDAKVKFASLVQSFFWKDYTADPGQTYTYTVNAMFGTPINHTSKFSTSIKVTTETLQKGKHSVYFNYGVTGSQGYATNKEFGNRPIDSLTGETREHALAYLGRELWSEGLLKFVRQARGAHCKLYGAFYEFQYPDFLKEIKAAKDSGAEVQIVYSGQPDQKEKNEVAIDHAELNGDGKTCHSRTKANQPHNKFMVLWEGDKPTQVWTGSTNITPAGIFGQCNTGHWIQDADIAAKYMTYWNKLVGNPSLPDLAKVSTTIQADTDLTQLQDGTYVFFSARDLPKKKGVTPAHLVNYSALIDDAKELVCMIFPFNFDDVFQTVYAEDKPYLRFLIFEKAAQAKSVKSNDTDLKVTAGAVLDSKVEQWAKEVTAKQTTDAGVLYVHNKFFIIDALGQDPVVVTGSANFSAPSITDNDENSILIKGDKRVADIYLTEFNRLFEHFWPRYLRKLHPPSNTKEGFEKPLDETYTWHLENFDKAKFGWKRKQMFINMKGAKSS